MPDSNEGIQVQEHHFDPIGYRVEFIDWLKGTPKKVVYCINYDQVEAVVSSGLVNVDTLYNGYSFVHIKCPNAQHILKHSGYIEVPQELIITYCRQIETGEK